MLDGVAWVKVLKKNKMIGGWVTTVASGRVASVILGSKVLVAWIESRREPWPFKIWRVLMA